MPALKSSAGKGSTRLCQPSPRHLLDVRSTLVLILILLHIANLVRRAQDVEVVPAVDEVQARHELLR